MKTLKVEAVYPMATDGSTTLSSASEVDDTALQPFTEVPDGTPGRGRWSGTSRRTPWRFDAEIGCPAPIRPHHVTITASITDRSMTPGHQAQPAILDPSPPMTEGVRQLCEPRTWL